MHPVPATSGAPDCGCPRFAVMNTLKCTARPSQYWSHHVVHPLVPKLFRKLGNSKYGLPKLFERSLLRPRYLIPLRSLG
jgi:hypothetical protein